MYRISSGKTYTLSCLKSFKWFETLVVVFSQNLVKVVDHSRQYD